METISADLIRGKIDALILRRIAMGEAYGTEVAKFITEASGGTYELKKPTLYSALRRLETKKFISGNDVLVDHVRRRYYKLTETGNKYFAERKGDWRHTNDVIAKLLGELPLEAQSQRVQSESETVTVLQKFFQEKREEQFDLPLGAAVAQFKKQSEPVKTPQEAALPLPQVISPTPFNKYIGPEERPIWQRQQPTSREPDPTLAKLDALTGHAKFQPSDHSEVHILPFNKSWKTRAKNRFVLINRLRATVSFISALVVAIAIGISGAILTDQVGGQTAFVLGFLSLAIYLGIHVSIFLVYPFLKKRFGNYKTEFLVRFAISASLLVSILGFSIAASGQYFAYFLVPALLSLLVFLEGVGIYLIKKHPFFQV